MLRLHAGVLRTPWTRGVQVLPLGAGGAGLRVGGRRMARGRPAGVLAGALLSASVLLLGVTVAVGLGVASSFARRRGGASGGTEALQVVELRRWRIWLRAGPCAGGGAWCSRAKVLAG
jgi:hypothetical protein